MRILVTGAHGFVSPYVEAAVSSRQTLAPIWYLTSREGGRRSDGAETVALDVRDRDAVARMVRDVRPDAVIHLAGVTSLPRAAADSHETWRVNVFGTLNLAHALMEYQPGAVFMSIGTGLAYGEAARDGHALVESDILVPQNDYAVTKAAADLALGALIDRGIKILRFRPFNHFGPGQTETFVIPSFVGQVARIEAGNGHPIMKVGNLDVARDFLDVRDVANAYATALERSDTLENGLILNIASGQARSLQSLLDLILNETNADIEVVTDPARLRPGELPVFCGNAGKAHRLLDWSPQIDLSETIRQMLSHARAAL